MKTLYTKEMILSQIININGIEVLEEREDRISILDSRKIKYPKKTTYYFNEKLEENLPERIVLPINTSENIIKDTLIRIVKETLNHYTLSTLDRIFFIESKEDLQEVIEYTADENIEDILDLEDNIGITLHEKNIHIINLGLLKSLMKNFEGNNFLLNEDFNLGCWSNILIRETLFCMDRDLVININDYTDIEEENEFMKLIKFIILFISKLYI